MASETRVWRQTQSGRCGFCGHRHTLDIEYRCVGCDRDVCAFCYVTERREDTGFCPECARPEAPED